jgi:crotonobetainyl-CoA:carnitine CoA-transferase CaiB-like acyl-CoA transferase
MTRNHVLEGLKIVSMAEQFPGPFATMLMADMGADVIMVERPGAGDPSRFLPPFFETLNRGKRSVALDVKTPADKANLLNLIGDADIFLEGFRPGKLAKIGLGYDDLAKINPRLIYASISGYGQDGPYRDRPGHDISYQGVGGALYERLGDTEAGAPSNILLGDVSSALFATIGVLAALEARHHSGKGCYIDVAMSDTVTSFMTAQLGMALNGGEKLPGPSAEPGYDLFRTSDGKGITISVAHEDDYWLRLCMAVGLPEFAKLPRRDRVGRRDEINGAIREAVAKQPFEHWDRVFTASDQMFGPAHDRADVASDPHAIARKLIETFVHPDGRKQIVLRQPLKFHGYENAAITPSPKVGEHNDALFGTLEAAE